MLPNWRFRLLSKGLENKSSNKEWIFWWGITYSEPSILKKRRSITCIPRSYVSTHGVIHEVSCAPSSTKLLISHLCFHGECPNPKIYWLFLWGFKHGFHFLKMAVSFALSHCLSNYVRSSIPHPFSCKAKDGAFLRDLVLWKVSNEFVSKKSRFPISLKTITWRLHLSIIRHKRAKGVTAILYALWYRCLYVSHQLSNILYIRGKVAPPQYHWRSRLFRDCLEPSM